jgi:type II secretory pathway pseudopilin PulG
MAIHRDARGPNRRSRGTAFSLVELLIVLALMIILYCMLFSSGSRSYQRRQQAVCRQNLQFIYMALQIYAGDQANRYPAAKGAATSEAPLSLLVPRYTARTDIFICPGSRHRKLPDAQPFAQRKISYAYLMGLTKDAPADQWLMSDAQAHLRPKEVGEVLFALEKNQAGNNHRQFGGNLLFCDGRTEFSPSLASSRLAVPTNTVPLNPRP